jgi:hydroxyethylthiazole kinase-like uncharacterized protein yjeF
MTDLLTTAQMQAIEQAAIESGEVTGLELMERAGRGVVEAVFEEWPELEKAPHRAVVLCGPGNNGGDGFVVARLLKEWGWEVEVFLYGDPEKLPPDARKNFECWVEQGRIQRLGMPFPAKDEIDALDAATRVTLGDAGPALIVDALFGTGLTRPISGLRGALDEVQIDERRIDREQPFVIAVDIASGICADSGKVIGSDDSVAVSADLTVSFHRRKRGHVLNDGPIFCGAVKVADIGLDANRRQARLALAALHGTQRDKPGHLMRHKTSLVDRFGASHPSLPKPLGHKYTHGHALILSGGARRTGAARLAARGALRIGAGVVTIGVPPSAQMEVACRVTALMLNRVEGGEGLAEVLQDDRLNAVCLGPGLGVERARELVPVALGGGGLETHPTRSVVLDADALTAYEGDPEALFGMLHENCVLTPHGGEFARLFPDIAGKLNAAPTRGPAFSKVDATRAAAKRAGCVVLFKGQDTVIAAPDGRCSINSAQYERSAPWLATAGAGDVLAGFITGLLSRGFASMQAAETGAWLHVECARSFGPGLIAEDLPEELPKVLRALGV